METTFVLPAMHLECAKRNPGYVRPLTLRCEHARQLFFSSRQRARLNLKDVDVRPELLCRLYQSAGPGPNKALHVAQDECPPTDWAIPYPKLFDPPLLVVGLSSDAHLPITQLGPPPSVSSGEGCAPIPARLSPERGAPFSGILR
jgi:hypothetical protein